MQELITIKTKVIFTIQWEVNVGRGFICISCRFSPVGVETFPLGVREKFVQSAPGVPRDFGTRIHRTPPLSRGRDIFA